MSRKVRQSSSDPLSFVNLRSEVGQFIKHGFDSGALDREKLNRINRSLSLFSRICKIATCDMPNNDSRNLVARRVIIESVFNDMLQRVPQTYRGYLNALLKQKKKESLYKINRHAALEGDKRGNARKGI